MIPVVSCEHIVGRLVILNVTYNYWFVLLQYEYTRTDYM